MWLLSFKDILTSQSLITAKPTSKLSPLSLLPDHRIPNLHFLQLTNPAGKMR